jgi:hypothetical protein
MVLRDARMHEMVDDGSAECKCAGPVPHHFAVPALLQCSHSLLQEPGTLLNHSTEKHVDGAIVLATDYDLLLLWSAQPRPSLPHLLPPALFAPTRRVVGAITSPLLLAAYLRLDASPLYSTHVLYGLPRFCPQQYTYIHLESQEPGYIAQLPRPTGIQSPLPAMGSAVLLSHHARDSAKGRDVWHCCWPQ